MQRARTEIQAAIATMSADEVRASLAKACPQLTETDALRVRRLAAGMAPESQKQAELAVYVFDEDPDPITEAALDLFALEELKDRPAREVLSEPVARDFSLGSPF